jgi:hypothetical protein
LSRLKKKIFLFIFLWWYSGFEKLMKKIFLSAKPAHGLIGTSWRVPGVHLLDVVRVGFEHRFKVANDTLTNSAKGAVGRCVDLVVPSITF